MDNIVVAITPKITDPIFIPMFSLDIKGFKIITTTTNLETSNTALDNSLR